MLSKKRVSGSFGALALFLGGDGTWLVGWFSFNHAFVGQPWWCSGLAPPAALSVILETRDESHLGLPAWSLLLPLPVSLPLSLSLCLSFLICKVGIIIIALTL